MKEQINLLNENVGETYILGEQLRNLVDEILGSEPTDGALTKTPEKPYNLAFLFDDYNSQHHQANNNLRFQIHRLSQYLNGSPNVPRTSLGDVAAKGAAYANR